MDIRPLSTTHAVSGQITPDEISAIAEAGFSVIVCNRPDAEVPAGLQAAALRTAAEAAGLEFVDNPIDGRAMSLENVEIQKRHLGNPDRPVLAYCASGTRSAAMWALASASLLPVGEILGSTAAAGYNLEGLRSQIEDLARG